jgi:hypothetical protein
MKTKTSNARKSIELTDVTALSATVNKVDMHTYLYVSQNSKCHIKLCSRSPNLGSFFTLPNFEFRNTRVISCRSHWLRGLRSGSAAARLL